MLNISYYLLQLSHYLTIAIVQDFNFLLWYIKIEFYYNYYVHHLKLIYLKYD